MTALPTVEHVLFLPVDPDHILGRRCMSEGTPPGASDVAGIVILVSRTIPKAKRDAVCWRALAQRRRLTTANDNGGGALRMVGGAS